MGHGLVSYHPSTTRQATYPPRPLARPLDTSSSFVLLFAAGSWNAATGNGVPDARTIVSFDERIDRIGSSPVGAEMNGFMGGLEKLLDCHRNGMRRRGCFSVPLKRDWKNSDNGLDYWVHNVFSFLPDSIESESRVLLEFSFTTYKSSKSYFNVIIDNAKWSIIFHYFINYRCPSTGLQYRVNGKVSRIFDA